MTVAVTRREADPSRALVTELDRRREALLASAAASIDPERFRAIALAAFTRTPTLWDCDPVTVARSIIEAAQLGLEPTGTLGGAYLVPFRNKRSGRKECQLIIGYRGMVELARRSGEVATVEARVVREADEFEYAYGLEPTLVHRPALDGDPGKLAHVYAIARFRSGAPQFDVMSAAEVEVIRRRSRASDEGPWVTDYFEMAKKTIVRRLAKLLPLTIEAREALAREDEWEGESRPAAPATRSAELRRRLQSRLAEPELAQIPDEVPEPDGPPERSEEPTAPPPEPTTATCDSLSPYDLRSTCVLDAGHSGHHRSSAKESW